MRPIYGKTYALTSAKGSPSIMQGNTWSESEVKPTDGLREEVKKTKEWFKEMDKKLYPSID